MHEQRAKQTAIGREEQLRTRGGGRQRIFVRETFSRLLASPGLNELRRPRLSPCQRCSWLRPRSFVWMHRRECVPKYAERNSIPNSPNFATDTTNNYMNLRSFSSALNTVPLFSSFRGQRKICPEPYQMREASGGRGEWLNNILSYLRL